MGFAQVDNGPMDLLSPWRRWARPAGVALALAALTAVPAPPALAAPEPSGPEALAAARAEAACLQREVDKLDVKVETLAEAHSAAQARLDGLIQAAHRHQAELERSELALQATRAEYAGDVRDLYARGPPSSCCWPPATSTSWPWPPGSPATCSTGTCAPWPASG